MPISKNLILFSFNAEEHSSGFKLTAKSISSTISLFKIFLTHPPTYLISLSSE